jgi:hypothetical protein
MEKLNEIALAITGHAIAQDQVMHAPTYIDWIDLDEAVVIKGSSEAGCRRVKQYGTPMKTARIVHRKPNRNGHASV